MSSVATLKCIQLVQTVVVFVLPALLVAYFAGKRKGQKTFEWLRLDKKPSWSWTLCWMALIVVASPAVNWLSELNQQVHLPESMADLEANLRSYEDMAAEITMAFLRPSHWYDLFLNLCLMAFLPALSEELTFRGMLLRWKSHFAVWTVAIIFSAIHMQFFGFVPRMLLGAMLGYAYLASGNLWVPICMHATNNTIAVCCYDYAFRHNLDVENMSTWGAGETWWLGLISVVVTTVGLVWLYKQNKKECNSKMS